MNAPTSTCKPHRETSSTSTARFSKLRGLITVNLPAPAAGTRGSLRRSLTDLWRSTGGQVLDMMPEPITGSANSQELASYFRLQDYIDCEMRWISALLDQGRSKPHPVNIQIASMTRMRPKNRRDAHE